MISANEALARLRKGNRRYIAGEGAGPPGSAHRERRAEVAEGQEPFAVLLGCADSRVPPELVFDQGLGDLFAVRVAGHVATPATIGSIEAAVSWFGTRLVVVLGHSRCGAVRAAMDYLQEPAPGLSPYMKAVLEVVRPSIESLVTATPPHDPDILGQLAVRAHIRKSVQDLQQASPILKQQVQEEDLVVIGAEYSLDTGEVLFFEE